MKARLVATAFVLLGLAECSGPEPPLPRLDAARTSTTTGVTVTSANPDSASQDTTLDVHVLGGGFDRGSTAQWAQNSVVSPNVKTNSTKYVSASELVANITIALSASAGSYDILVTTSKGKKGIGSELFTITLKHNDIATITVTPATNRIAVGASVQLTATAYNATGTVLTKATFTWASSNPAVAGVSSSGLMTTVGQGTATITASSGSSSGMGTVNTFSNLTFASVSAGSHYSCALAADGSGYCWGANDQSQLGNGSTVDVLGPSAMSGGVTFSTASVQYAGGCGLVNGGSAWCWGGVGEPTTSGGELGGGNSQTAVPVPLVGGMTFSAVSVFDGSACGLGGSGVVYCWGWNKFGQLGNGTTTDSPTPVAASGGLAFITISGGGDDHVCALSAAGVAYCWGINGYGQIGDGSTTQRNAPTAVSGGLTFATISAGTSSQTCGLTPAGAAYCWGLNSYGQLGNGTTTNNALPVPVSGGLSFTSISTGGHTCGITTGGAAYCWGFNKHGQLGNGSTSNSSVPVPVSGGLSFASIRAGTQHTCGLTTSGVTYCWGWNLRGELGDGTQIDSWTPVKVIGQP